MEEKPSSGYGCLSILVSAFIVFVILAILGRNDKSLGGYIALAIVSAIFILMQLNRLAEPANKRRLERLLDNFPEIKESVKVISKTNEVSRAYGSNEEVKTTHYISFQFPDGSRKNFEVDVSTYNIILENDFGILKYKEMDNTLYFVDFQAEV